MSGNHLQSVINGRPTEPQVRALMDKFGTTERGTTLTHEQLAAAMSEQAGSGRYRVIVGIFRRRMLNERGIWLECLPRVGYEALEAERQMRVPLRKMRQGARRIFEGLRVAEVTPPAQLSEATQRERDHLLTRGPQLRDALLMEVRASSLRLGSVHVMPKNAPN